MVCRRQSLARTVFPLAKMSKTMRAASPKRITFPSRANPTRRRSVLFPTTTTSAFLKREGVDAKPGYFRDRLGAILGKHDGSVGLTVGQRKGLGVAGFAEAQFVLDDAVEWRRDFRAPRRARTPHLLHPRCGFSGRRPKTTRHGAEGVPCNRADSLQRQTSRSDSLPRRGS
jgi:tRNA U34 2-thiouridine synthase MnmA/TrmU